MNETTQFTRITGAAVVALGLAGAATPASATAPDPISWRSLLQEFEQARSEFRAANSEFNAARGHVGSTELAMLRDQRDAAWDAFAGLRDEKLAWEGLPPYHESGREYSINPRSVANLDPTTGKVTFDYGADIAPGVLGVDDAIAVKDRHTTKISIRDLLRNDLGLVCNEWCRIPDAAKNLTLVDGSVTAGDNISSIVERNGHLIVRRGGKSVPSTFTYQVSDGRHIADVTATIWYGNRAPVAKPNRITTSVNRSAQISINTLLRNDFDKDGDPLRFIRAFSPVKGTVSLVRNRQGKVIAVRFTPNRGFIGTTYFRYTIADVTNPDKTFATGIVRVNVEASPS